MATPSSLLAPRFVRALGDPSIGTVLICGCGGGFDFVHGLLLLPELWRLGKRVVIASYSFGDPDLIGGAPLVYGAQGDAVVRRVSAACEADPYYGPEVHLASMLDIERPAAAPHELYACYARAFSVPTLLPFYEQLVREHAIDAVVLVDGGSDSLMRGDEEGLGDPIEDAVSVATVAALEGPRLKVLLSVGLGADRYNHVSDASTLRAVAELTAQGGFLGSVSIERDSAGFSLYQRGLEHIYERQEFRSALAGLIVAATGGHFGSERVPTGLERRLRPGAFFVWPLMAMLWAFDVEAVAQRSLIAKWIRLCPTPMACRLALLEGRRSLLDGAREVEDLPRHLDMRCRR